VCVRVDDHVCVCVCVCMWLQACGHQRPADAVVRLNAQTLIDTFFLTHTLPLLRSHSFSLGDLSLAAIADVTGALKKSGS
jgi:hypothetical protein